jgi:hypothetical protein
MGLLFSFQGTYIASYSAPYSLGMQFAIFWFIFPWVYIVLYLLSYWIIGGYNKGQLLESTALLGYGVPFTPVGVLQNFVCGEINTAVIPTVNVTNNETVPA